MRFKNDLIKMVKLSHAERRKYIKDFLSENQIPYEEHKYDTGINIEVSTEGLQENRQIVFFSHYDISKNTRQGANDNTSSVIVMLNVAKYLNNITPLCSVKIVFNDSEEIIGALFNKIIDSTKSLSILRNVGSFNYLKRNFDKRDVVGIFILELSGIGNSLYIAKKSGGIDCNPNLINFLSQIAEKNHLPYTVISVPSCDMLSAFVEKLPAVVLGAIPNDEAKELNRAGIFPSSWKTIHTFADNHLSINEESLQMLFDFVVMIIENITFLKNQ